MSRDIEASRPHLSPASVGGAASELRSGDRIITPEELQGQGNETIARVKGFFDGIDMTTPAPYGHHLHYKKGLLDIGVADCRISGEAFKVATARVNGFEVAEMRIYDPAIGSRRKLDARTMYELKGATGDSGSVICRTFVFEYESGVSLTTIFAEYRSSAERKIASHEIGTIPHGYVSEESQKWYESHRLNRSAEVAILKELGVPITFTKEPSDFQIEALHYL